MAKKHRIHMISFQRIDEDSYATFHPGERMQPFMYELLAELVDSHKPTNTPQAGAVRVEDLA